jgi:putative ABC transport system permease protein
MKKLRFIIRHFLTQKLSTSFVLISFSVAFSCCILVYLFVSDEFAYDRFNANYDRIYRLTLSSKDKSAINSNFPGVFYDRIKNISGIEKVARLQTFSGKRYISINNTTYEETGFLFGDPEILEILKFDFLLGNPQEALSKPFSVIISRSIAEKYFGSVNALGKTINEDYHDFTVTGVIDDLPKQSHLPIKFLASVSSYETLNSRLLTTWYMSAFSYYFLLPEGAGTKRIETELADSFAEGNGVAADKRDFDCTLQPLRDIHLKAGNVRWDNAIKGDIKIVLGFIVIALLISGIAVANYINVLTADYRRKVRETGIRRVNGASKRAIIADQLAESLTIFLLSMIIADLLSYFLLPVVNDLCEKSLSINLSVLALNLVLIFLSTIVTVIYPLVFMHSFEVSDALKNKIRTTDSHRQNWVRGSLITFQLAAATILIIATIVVNRQLQLLLSTKVGFDKENVLLVDNPYSPDMDKRYEIFREKLLALPMVRSVGVTQNAPCGFINNYSNVWLPGNENQKVLLGQITVDHSFLNTIGAKFIAGRNFSNDFPSDTLSGMVLNKSAVQALNLAEPVGKMIVVQNNAPTPGNELEVIGVIDDMQYFTLHESAKPVMYYVRNWGRSCITIKLGKGDYSETILMIKGLWKEVAPDWPFDFQFMDERISTNYRSEINAGKIISCLSGIAIFLSILGILGTIIFSIQQRTKEIGIRKVNGARVTEVVVMLNTDLVKWALTSVLIATPVSYLAMNKWLGNFAYKATLSWWIFALAGLLILIIALITASWQSLRAATRNPVEALRYE